jgi:hypothetical protein
VPKISPHHQLGILRGNLVHFDVWAFSNLSDVSAKEKRKEKREGVSFPPDYSEHALPSSLLLVLVDLGLGDHCHCHWTSPSR